MYRAIWRILPGRLWAKALQASVLAIAVALVLLEWVFPFMSSILLVEGSVVEK